MSRGADRGCASAPDHRGCRGCYAACTTGARAESHGFRASAAADKAGLLGLVKKTRFAAEHWESQVHWESVHRGDQACAVDTLGLNIQWSGQAQHASICRCGAIVIASLERLSQIATPTWRGSVLTGEEPPPHSGELNHALSHVGGPTQSQLSALCRQDTTSPWSTDYGGNIQS